MPKISIITTAYKHEKFIGETIESIINQSYKDWELLIGDDSPDNKTWEIIEKYVKQYPDKIKAFHHKPNKGIVGNMNFLLERVSKESEYIAFLEGDDLFTKENLQKRIDIFGKYKNIKLVVSNYSIINKKSNIKKESFLNKIAKIYSFEKKIEKGKNNISFKKFIELHSNPVKSFGAVLIKKKVLKNYLPLKGLDKKSKMFGPLDYFLWLQILPGIEFFYTSEKLLQYRVHSNNFSGDGNKKVMNSQGIMIFDYFLEKYKDNKDIVNVINYRKSFKESLDNTIMGNRKIGFKYFFETFKYYKFKFLLNRLKLLIRIIVPNFLLKIINII